MAEHKLTNRNGVQMGTRVELGMRVFTYDYKWGVIEDSDNNRAEMIKSHCLNGTCEAWFNVVYEDGANRAYDCSRLTDIDPR